MSERLRVAITHERFTEFAGSEKVVSELAALWPDASVFAPVVTDAGLDERLRGRTHGGRLSKLTRHGSYAHLLPLLPLAMRRLPLGEVDVVIASHHAFATQSVYATGAPVVAYVHSPARWVWEATTRSGEAGGAVGAAGLAAFAAAFRPADRAAARRVRTLVANSTAVARRIEQWWEREATVVHPPVDTSFYRVDPATEREDFFLLAGRLVPYKRPDLAIRAAQAAGVRLVVAGDGRFRRECEQLAGGETTFVGRVDDAMQRRLYQRCAALLMPGVEDFGIVPVEAQACGAPVLATQGGGALDTVIEGASGTLLGVGASERERLEIWTAALAEFRRTEFSPAVVRLNAERFSPAVFRAAMQGIVTKAVATPQPAPGPSR